MYIRCVPKGDWRHILNRTMEHINCGTPECCTECDTSTTQENTMSIKELMEEIEKLKARVEELEKKIHTHD